MSDPGLWLLVLSTQTARRRSEALAIRAASFQPDDLSAATSSVLQPMIRRRSSVAFAGRRSSVAAVDRRTSVFASESPAFDLPPPSYDAPEAVPLAEMTVDQVSRAGEWSRPKTARPAPMSPQTSRWTATAGSREGHRRAAEMY